MEHRGGEEKGGICITQARTELLGTSDHGAGVVRGSSAEAGDGAGPRKRILRITDGLEALRDQLHPATNNDRAAATQAGALALFAGLAQQWLAPAKHRLLALESLGLLAYGDADLPDRLLRANPEIVEALVAG